MALQIINKSPETRLMQMLGNKQIQAGGWQAIHFHLSDLLEEYKSEYQIKIAINLIHDLLKSYDGSIFLLADYSIMVVCKKLEQPIMEKLTFQLRYLYMDDPLAYTDIGQENPKFCTVYDLKSDWQEFYNQCSHRMVMHTRKPAAPVPVELPEPKYEPKHEPKPEPKIAIPEPVETPLPVVEIVPEKQDESKSTDRSELSASKLAAMENTLRVTDIKNVVRRQPVCAVLPDMKVRRVFDELYINIAHLRRMIKSDVDFLSNRWLFKYITNILDERMIKLIMATPARFLDAPISINLNVETLLSSWFTEFDASISPANKVSIVLEIPVIDVFADMTAFSLACSEVQKLGYRVCLDGLTTASFSSINREKLGLDLVKVQWNADMHGDLKNKENQSLMEAVKSAGTNRVILCRCDNKSAVEYGHALGISLFQGRYLDSLLNPTSKVEN